MVDKLLKKLIRKINFLRYRFNYLFKYIIIGFFSVLLEVLFVRYVPFFSFPFFMKVVVGFLIGVFFSFILNAKLNFKIPKSKNIRTFTFFLIISTIAFILNLTLILVFKNIFLLNYGFLRMVTASIIFMGSYTAHRKLTFDFVKNVGIAIYLNKGENVSKIYSKIKYYADFIHIDLIDETLNKNVEKIDPSIINEIDKTWGLKKMLHIMSKKPSIWINKLGKKVDIIVFHLNIDEPIEEVIKLVKRHGKKIGISLNPNSEISELFKYLPKINFVQVMGINELGASGQSFNPDSLNKLNQLNKLKKKYKFELIFDGGVKPTNIHRINAKYIVSASGLLSSEKPVKSFMVLKTSSRYSSVSKSLRKDLILGIRKVIEDTGSIKSGSIVGSFSENKGLKGISDIDLVIIVDKLTKQKFEGIMEKFEALKQKLESKYGYKVFINNTFGPLKFNEKNIVFHLMVYDEKSHESHCVKSPFTCFDWERSKIFFKKPMSQICSAKFLQPSNFFNSRRSAKEYLSEIKSNHISYRKYKFNGNKVIEEKKYETMNPRDQIEFSYHIMKFLISNFLKLYLHQNKVYDFDKMVKEYFKIFPKNKFLHKKLIKTIKNSKENKKFKEIPNLIKNLELFIRDFEIQFKNYFYGDSKEIFFLRHGKTNLNKEKIFLGQKLNPPLINSNKRSAQKSNEILGEINLVFSSPSQRCIESLKLINKENIFSDKRLMEINYGDVEGKNLKYLFSNYPSIIHSWQKGKDPRFPNGENNLDVIKRVKEFFQHIQKYPDKKILICTHNVVLRSIIGSCLRIPVRDWFKINIPYFEPIKFIMAKDNRLYIEITPNQIKEIFKNL